MESRLISLTRIPEDDTVEMCIGPDHCRTRLRILLMSSVQRQTGAVNLVLQTLRQREETVRRFIDTIQSGSRGTLNIAGLSHSTCSISMHVSEHGYLSLRVDTVNCKLNVPLIGHASTYITGLQALSRGLERGASKCDPTSKMWSFRVTQGNIIIVDENPVVQFAKYVASFVL